MLHEAQLHQNIDLRIKFVQDNTAEQIRDIHKFIEEGVDLLIIAPNMADPLTPVVEEAFDKGIPVILVDRKISSQKYTAFIGADNHRIGRDVGSYVATLLEGKGNIVEIKGLAGSTPAQERSDGFFSVIKDYPDIKMLCQADGAWLKDSAEHKTEAILDSFPKIDLIFAQNDRMAMGAYNAAQKKGRERKIYFIGIDALPGKDYGIDQVLNDKLAATFIYPTGGDRIIQLALQILEKKPYKKNTSLFTTAVDKSNAQILKMQYDEILEQESKLQFLHEKVADFASRYSMQRYLLYSAGVIVLLTLIILGVLYYAFRSKNKLNVELAKKNDAISKQKNTLEQQRDQLITLSKQLEEATHAKLVFFTNISHEFRTPLTLISGPVNSMLASDEINPEQRRLLTLMQKNVNILLRLIDQIIDFRKYENDKLKLILSQENLKDLFIEWNESFTEIAEKKDITLNFQIISDVDYSMTFDLEKMERIYFNLLSNAFKFTAKNGKISVTLDKKTENGRSFAIVSVSNEGKGISEKDIRNIFDRFYQVDSHMAGSGIGLALVKALVELHEGAIDVTSIPDESTTFTFTIPFDLEKTNARSSQTEHKSYAEKESTTHDDLMDENEYPDDNQSLNKYSILVIDDNADVRTYVRSILSNQYTISEAKDGAEGLEKAMEAIPDIIISDVMMPEMDGVELCIRLKNELSTSHIPVILLTACSSDEQRIVGFEGGADSYISKPFNPSVLEVRIRKLIENRMQLAQYYNTNLQFDKRGKINVLDQQLLDRFTQYVNKYIDNADLSVEDIGKEVGLSRAQLYRKTKAITGIVPNELIRIIRLKKSVELLSSGKNVAETAYEVGFTSPSYFTKCFKDYFGKSPSEMML